LHSCFINRNFTIDLTNQSMIAMNSTTENQKEREPITLEIYDPAMCCSTGVCGPDVDDELADFANDLKWLKTEGIEVKRFNLGQEPEVFKSNPLVLSRLQKEGSVVLPIIFVNGELMSEGGYPDRATLTEWTKIQSQNGSNGSPDGQSSEDQHEIPGSNEKEIETSEPLFNEKTEILVVLAAALAAGNDSTMKAAFTRGEEAGISKEDLTKAMQTGLNLRQSSMSESVRSANELLGIDQNGCAPGSGCC
jgi:hypothetical protein